jgi:hypothetical protein
MRCRECGREFPEWSWENPVCPSCLARAKTGQPPPARDPNEEDFWKHHPDLKLRPVELDHPPAERTAAEFSVGSDHEDAATAREPAIHEPSHVHQFERTEHAQNHPAGARAKSSAPPVPEKYRIEQVGHATEFVADAKPSEGPKLDVAPRPVELEAEVNVAQPAERAEAPRKLVESSPSGKYALRMERGAYLRVEPLDNQSTTLLARPFTVIVGFFVLVLFSVGVTAPGAFFLVPASIGLLVYVYISLPHLEIIELTPLGMSRARLFGGQMKSTQAFQGRPTGAVVGPYGARGTKKLSRLAASLRESEVVIVSGKQWSEPIEPAMTAEDRSWLAGRVREFCLSLRRDQ